MEISDAGRLRIQVEGEAIEPGKLAVRDLTRLGELIQSGLERVARVLTGEPGGLPGPIPGRVRQVTELLLAGIEPGSATLVLELPPPKEAEDDEGRLFEPLPPDLGFRAMERFVDGLHQLELGGEEVPQHWDNSVMEIAQGLGEVVTSRGYVIQMDARHGTAKPKRARIAPDVADRFNVRHAPIRRPQTARGELILIDLRKGRIDLETQEGKRVQCQFDPDVADLMSRVKSLVGQVVSVSGEEEFDIAQGKAGRLEVHSLDAASEEVPLHEMFWRNLSAEEQAADQGVETLRSLLELSATELFSEAELEEFGRAVEEAGRDE